MNEVQDGWVLQRNSINKAEKKRNNTDSWPSLRKLHGQYAAVDILHNCIDHRYIDY